MKRWSRIINRAILAMSTVGLGMTQLNGCGLAAGATNLASSVNPCGTILDCDPIEFDFLFRDVDFPDFDECPISVFPWDCAGWPLDAETTDTGGTGTGTGTTTTTTTGTTGTTGGTGSITNPFLGGTGFGT